MAPVKSYPSTDKPPLKTSVQYNTASGAPSKAAAQILATQMIPPTSHSQNSGSAPQDSHS